MQPGSRSPRFAGGGTTIGDRFFRFQRAEFRSLQDLPDELQSLVRRGSASRRKASVCQLIVGRLSCRDRAVKLVGMLTQSLLAGNGASFGSGHDLFTNGADFAVKVCGFVCAGSLAGTPAAASPGWRRLENAIHQGTSSPKRAHPLMAASYCAFAIGPNFARRSSPTVSFLCFNSAPLVMRTV